LDERRFRVNNYVQLAILELSADITRINLLEIGLSMVQFYFSFSLDEVISFFVLRDPLPVDFTCCHT